MPKIYLYKNLNTGAEFEAGEVFHKMVQDEVKLYSKTKEDKETYKSVGDYRHFKFLREVSEEIKAKEAAEAKAKLREELKAELKAELEAEQKAEANK